MIEYRWHKEDLEFLLEQLEEGPILVAGPKLPGVPTIHDFPSGCVEHLGFGVLRCTHPDYVVIFTGGGALDRTPLDGHGWCRPDVRSGDWPYDREAVRRALRVNIDNLEAEK